MENTGEIKMEPQKILISLPNWLGDIVMSIPTIKGMRWLFPESHLAVLVHSNFAQIFKHNPDINEIIIHTRGEGWRKIFGSFKMAKDVRKKRFDMALILPRSFNSALVTFMSNIPERIGYEGDSRGLFLTKSLPRKDDVIKQHRVYYFLNLLNIFNKPVPFSAPRLYSGTEEEQWADGLLKRLNIPSKALLIGFNAGASHGKAKCWLPENYIELALKLINFYDAYILLLGGPAETRLNSRILKKVPKDKVIDLSGQTDILQLASLLKRCRLLVTNDTGPMHMAAALTTPVVAIFGSTDPVTTSPFERRHALIYKKVSCSPCHKRICPIDHKCMTQITAGEVFEACQAMLKNYI